MSLDSETVSIVFDGSKEEDVHCAKIFWHSAFLQPHLESNLVSDGIRQRLPIVCPLIDNEGNEIKRFNSLAPLVQLTEQCATRTNRLSDAAARKKIQEVNERRKEIREMLERQRQARIRLENLAKKA